MDKKVVVMTSVHQPYDNRIYEKEISSLVDRGWNVTELVATSVRNEPAICRIIQVSAPRSRSARVLISGFSIFWFALTTRASIYHFHDPELLPFGFLLKVCGKKVVYDVHENFPDDFRNKPYLPLVLRHVFAFAIQFLEFMGGIIFDGIVAVTPTIAARFPKGKTLLLRNFPKLSEFDRLSSNYLSRPQVVTYVGTVAISRGILEMINLVGLKKDYPALEISVAGGFAMPKEEMAVRNDIRSNGVNFLGHLNRGAVAALLSQTRVGLLILRPTKGYMESYPVKLFEYMAAGVPVVASDFEVWRDLLGEIRCAIFVDPDNSRQVEDAVRWLLEHPEEAEEMGKRGQRAVKEMFCWEKEAPRLDLFYKKLLRAN